MQSSLYVALSGQVALQKRLDTIANNIANMNTGGYRAEEVSFATVLSKPGRAPTAFATAGDSYISRRTGEMDPDRQPARHRRAGRRLVRGADAGRHRLYARRPPAHGRERRAADRQRLSRFSTPAARRSMLDPAAGAPTISQDGMITQNGRQIGAVGLFSIDAAAKLTRYDNSAVIPDKPGAAGARFHQQWRHAGHGEGSNVNPVLEMTQA